LISEDYFSYLLGIASVASALGQLDRSIELFERAVVLDPLGLEGLLSLGSRYIARGRYEDALALYQQVLVLYPENYFSARESIAEVYLRQGDPERALAEIDRLPCSHKLNSLKAETLFLMGREKESRALTSEFLNTPVREYPFPKARNYAWRGENDAAIAAIGVSSGSS
jgi:tetratricopeptide (TPR) repeat protein